MRDRSNNTPLMCAIEFGHKEVIEALVECGAHIQVCFSVFTLDSCPLDFSVILLKAQKSSSSSSYST